MNDRDGLNKEELFKEKRKWQIALRRYIVEKQKVSFYAPYFGIDIENCRKWIELQFTEGIGWENFGSKWQLDHIIPVIYFDFNLESDLRLCWNFVNIRVENLHTGSDKVGKISSLTAKAHFVDLLRTTDYSVCRELINKIELMEASQRKDKDQLDNFIKDNLNYLHALKGYASYEFDKLNSGASFKEVEAEKEMLTKFGR